MFGKLFGRVKKTTVTRKFGPDGKVVEETVTTTEQDADAAAKEVDDQQKKADEFFADMDKAFKKYFTS